MFAQFSDLFRLEMMVRHGGWWVDTDVICFSDTLPGEQVWISHTKTVQNAIMRFPPDHEFMRAAAAEARKRIHTVHSQRRTIIGPDLLTELRFSGRLHINCIPSDLSRCFKLKGVDVIDLGEPALTEALTEEFSECPMLHWWSEQFREINMRRDVLPPHGSYLATVFERHGGTGHMSMDLSEWRACAATVALSRKRKRRAKWIKRIKRLIIEKTRQVVVQPRRKIPRDRLNRPDPTR